MYLSRKWTKFPNTLSFRMTLWYASAMITFLGTAIISVYLSIAEILDQRMAEDLREDIAEFGQIYRAEGLNKLKAEIRRETQTSNAGQVFMRLLDTQGQEVYRSDLSQWQGLSSQSSLLPNLQSGRIIITNFSLASKNSGIKQAYGYISTDLVMHVGESMHEQEEILELIFQVFAVVFGILIPIACTIGWFITRKAVSGVEEVSRAAVDIEHGQLDRRVTVFKQRDEVQRLADTFNAMAERIRTLIAEMREMTDNVAHDLRSPLARIRAISEQVLSLNQGSPEQFRAAAHNTLDECDRLLKLINATLDVAEAEAGVGHQNKQEVQMTQLTHDAVELFQPLAEQKGIKLTVHIAENCKLFGHKYNLQRMLANIVDNAIKYTPENGAVSVSLAKQQGGLMLSVADTGIGIPQAEQKRVFERFFRCDHSRSSSGCGLGLSFSRAVARAHGGDITVESELARHSIFTIHMPMPIATH